MLRSGLSSLGRLRVFNNAFQWQDEKWSLSAALIPPQLLLEGKVVRVAKQSHLNFSLYPRADRYQKGFKPETYFLRMQDLARLTLWRPTDPLLSFVGQSKIISFQKQDISSKLILVSFYDQDLPGEQKRKEITVPEESFQFFLETMGAGIQEITHRNHSQQSLIHDLMKSFPPITSGLRR